MAETEEAHRTAFNTAFARAGLGWHWSQDDYRALLTTTGGRERIARHMAERHSVPNRALIAALHEEKNALYAELVASGAVVARPGVLRLIEEACARGVALAIATTTSRTNLIALLHHVFGAAAVSWFLVMVTGEDVAHKKPDPEVYRRALGALSCDPGACVAIEDSRPGLDAARGAGLFTVVTPSHYTAHEDFGDADLLVPDLFAPPGVTIDLLASLLSPA